MGLLEPCLADHISHPQKHIPAAADTPAALVPPLCNPEHWMGGLHLLRIVFTTSVVHKCIPCVGSERSATLLLLGMKQDYACMLPRALGRWIARRACCLHALDGWIALPTCCIHSVLFLSAYLVLVQISVRCLTLLIHLLRMKQDYALLPRALGIRIAQPAWRQMHTRCRIVLQIFYVYQYARISKARARVQLGHKCGAASCAIDTRALTFGL